MARKLALIIGNSQYDDARLAQLTAPGADVRAFADVLRAPDICKFDEVTPLVDEGCAAVRKAIARFYDQRRRDDLLLLYFSGHGVKDENGHLYLALRDTESSLLAGTAIEASFITGRMDRSSSKRLVLILDCCYGGAFAVGSKAVQGGSVGTAAAFQGAGCIVLTATDATQYAWEGNRILGGAQTSLFTRFMIEGLQTGAADRDEDGEITVDELYDYVYDRVLDATPAQTPGKWSRLQGRIVLADNAAAKRMAVAGEHCAAARAAIERKQFAAALEALRRATELCPTAEGLADLIRCATEGKAAAEEAERARLEIAQKNDEARRQLARQNFSTARVLVEDGLRRDPNSEHSKKLLAEIRHDELLARFESEFERVDLESAEQALAEAEIEFAGAPDVVKSRARLNAAKIERRARELVEDARRAADARSQADDSQHSPDPATWKLRPRLVSGALASAIVAVLISWLYNFGTRSTVPLPPISVPPSLQKPATPPDPPLAPPQPSAEAPPPASEQAAAAVSQARQQFARGDRETALKTVESALALDAHSQAAQTFRTELMKDAQRRATRAAAAAARAGAPADASDVRAAQQVHSDARVSDQAGDHEAAIRKYWNAAELFDLIARTPRPADTAASHRLPGVQPAVQIKHGASEVTATEPDSPREAPRSPTAAPPAPTPPTVAPPSPTTSAAAAASVLEVMRQYEAAYNRLDVAAIVRIVPSVNVAQLERSFAALRSYQVTLVDPHVSVEGQLAEVTCLRKVAIKPRVGSAQNASDKTTFRLRRSGATWIIDKVDSR